MKWRRRAIDRHRWHCRFALLPKRIGEYRVWLESYRWRHLHPREKPKDYLGSLTIRVYRAYETHDGYVAWREKTLLPGPLPLSSTIWMEPSVGEDT